MLQTVGDLLKQLSNRDPKEVIWTVTYDKSSLEYDLTSHIENNLEKEIADELPSSEKLITDEIFREIFSTFDNWDSTWEIVWENLDEIQREEFDKVIWEYLKSKKDTELWDIETEQDNGSNIVPTGTNN